MQVLRRWRALRPEARLVATLATLFFVFRLLLATQSGFGFHQGWNEGYYALMADGYSSNPLVPTFRGDPFYATTPLFSYVVAASFAVFGESVLAARLPSVLAAALTIPATYALGRVVYEDRRIGLVGALVLAVLPYFQLYGGRAQTDALMLFFFTTSLTCIVAGYQREDGWAKYLISGGALFALGFATKQPVVLLPAVVLLWLVFDRRFDRETLRRTAVLIVASALAMVPLFAWFLLNYLSAPAAFVGGWSHELFHRTAPFANVTLVAGIGLLLGMTPPVLVLAGAEAGVGLRRFLNDVRGGFPRGSGPTVVGLWLVIYGAFVFYRSPSGHQYYAVALATPMALLAARALFRFRPLLGSVTERLSTHGATALVFALVLVGGALGSVVLFDLSGEFSVVDGSGAYVAEDASAYLQSNAPPDATIFVPNGYGPPVLWYLRASGVGDGVRAYHPSDLDERRLFSAVANDSGPVYLLVPQPSWAPRPDVPLTRLYRSERYRLTTTSLAPDSLRPSGKFVHYFEFRRLVVYRVCPDAADCAVERGADRSTHPVAPS